MSIAWPGGLPAELQRLVRDAMPAHRRLRMSCTGRAERAAWLDEERRRLLRRYPPLASAPATEGPVELMRRRRLTVLPRRRPTAPWADPGEHEDPADSAADSDSESDSESGDGSLQPVPGDIVALTDSGRFALTWDGRVWEVGGPQWARRVPVPAGASGSSGVVRLSGSQDEDELAVIRDDGALLLAHHQDLAFVETPLGGEWATEVFVGDHEGCALTREGSVWAWGFSVNAHGVRHDEQYWDGWTPPVRVTELAGGRAAPRFTTLAAEPDLGMCAMDAQGRLYACGIGMFVDEAGEPWQLLVKLPPAPVPVHQLFTRRWAAQSQFVTSAASSRSFRVLRRSARGDPLRALLVDGTVWGLSSQERVPDVEGVAHVHSVTGNLLTTDARVAGW